MGTNFNIELVNGPSGDPAVYVNFAQNGHSILFDAGMLETLTNREILKIKVVAISHTHVDHFVGFDRIIRVNVPHYRTVEVVGPEGIAKNVQGKLNGYTWNLLEPNQITYIVHEVTSNFEVITYEISNNNQFVPVVLRKHPSTVSNTHTSPHSTPQVVKIPLLHAAQEECYELSATILDHRLDVLAFSLTFPDSIIVNKAALAASGLRAGPWVSELQQLSTSNNNNQTTISIDGISHNAQALARDLLVTKAGEKLIYITDIAFTSKNVARLKALANSKPKLVICEANFQQKDRDKAVKTAHLTTRQAALIAALLGASELKPFHFSNSYANDIETSLDETEEACKKYFSMTHEELQIEASGEYADS